MAWLCDWSLASIDPLDAAYWEELLAAVAERRAATGRPFSTPQGQPRRGPAAWRLLADSNGLAHLWDALRGAVDELAPLFYSPDALAFNAATTLFGEAPEQTSPLSPAPPTMEAWLPAPFDPAPGMVPTADAARRAMRSAYEALDAMRLVALTPSSLGPGVVLRTPSEWARVLPSAHRVDGYGSRTVAADAGVFGLSLCETAWAYQAEASGIESISALEARFRLLRAAPYLVARTAYYRGDLLVHAPVGGTLRIHAAAPWRPESHPGDPDFADIGTEHVVPLGEQITIGWAYFEDLTLGRDTSRAPGGPPGTVSVGWQTLGDVAPGRVRVFLSAPAALPPADTAATFAEATAGWDDSEHPIHTCLRTRHRLEWTIDCAYLDCSRTLSKISPDT